MPKRSPGRHWWKWRVRSRCREPCPTPTGRRKSSGIRARWLDRALASDTRLQTQLKGPVARVLTDVKPVGVDLLDSPPPCPLELYCVRIDGSSTGPACVCSATYFS